MRSLINALLGMVMCGQVVAASAPAYAYAASSLDESGKPGVTVLQTALPGCVERGGLCVTAGESTVKVPTTLLAGAAAAGVMTSEVPAFRRVLQLDDQYQLDLDGSLWTVQISASLRKRALSGNALFILTDAEDPEQTPASHVMTGLYQAQLPAGDSLNAALSLSPNDGFHAGHTYRLRVVQIVGGKEVELADGSFRLL